MVMKGQFNMQFSAPRLGKSLLIMLPFALLLGCNDSTLDAVASDKNTGPSYVIYDGDSVIRTDNSVALEVRISHFLEPERRQVALISGGADLVTSKGSFVLEPVDE